MFSPEAGAKIVTRTLYPAWMPVIKHRRLTNLSLLSNISVPTFICYNKSKTKNYGVQIYDVSPASKMCNQILEEVPDNCLYLECPILGIIPSPPQFYVLATTKNLVVWH